MFARLLEQQGVRQYNDGDLLISPTDLTRALARLTASGYVDRYAGVHPGEVADHARTLVWHLDGRPAGELDLHTSFPGMDSSAQLAWDRLLADAEPIDVAGVECLAPSRTANLLLVVLHAARSGLSDNRSQADLKAALDLATPADWAAVKDLATALDALPSMRAGLETTSRGAALVVRLGVEAGIDARWRLLSQSAGEPAYFVARVLGAGWRERPGLVARELFPTVARMRADWALARRGPVGLLLSYVVRLVTRARLLPDAVRRATRAQRESRPPGT